MKAMEQLRREEALKEKDAREHKKEVRRILYKARVLIQEAIDCLGDTEEELNLAETLDGVLETILTGLKETAKQ